MVILIIAIVLVVAGILLIVAGKKKSAKNAGDMSEAEQEMRYMRPTPVQDATEIVDELDAQSMGYRHYVELNGTSGTDEQIIGPYSKREVAYYEVKCYQVTRTNSGTEEKLLAHEKSITPFWLKDGSGDNKVYVDMDSFGSDVMLINSCNRMEGPKSEFAQQALGLTSSKTTPFGVAINCAADETIERVTPGGLLHGFAEGVQGIFDPGRAFKKMQASSAPALALAGAGGYGQVSTSTRLADTRLSDAYDADSRSYRDNVLFAHGPGRPVGGGGFPGGGFGGGGHRPGGRVPDFGGFGGFGGGRPPMGGGTDMGDLIGGLVIGGIMASLLSQSNEGDRVNPETFMGYRIVENIIPANSQVFTIGDLYKNGDRYYIGRSTNSEAKKSYFSARPEEEVIASMKKSKPKGNPFIGFAVVLFVAAALCFGYYAFTANSGSGTAPSQQVTNTTAPTNNSQHSTNPSDYYYENGVEYWYDESTGYWYDQYGNAYYDEDDSRNNSWW